MDSGPGTALANHMKNQNRGDERPVGISALDLSDGLINDLLENSNEDGLINLGSLNNPTKSD